MFYFLLARDCIEILSFSTCIFIFCIWLKKDKTKNLLIYFFLFCVTIIGAWLLQLPTLTTFLYAYSPIILLLFIIFHEKTLQRNFIAMHSTPLPHFDSTHWLDMVLSGALTLLNHNKYSTILIEYTDSLQHFLNVPFFINADISKHIFDILFSDPICDEKKMMWFTTQGKIRCINATWISDINNKDVDDIFYTLQTDAIILKTNPENRTFIVITQGKELINLSAHQVQLLLKKQLSCSKAQKGIYRENRSIEKSSIQ